MVLDLVFDPSLNEFTPLTLAVKEGHEETVKDLVCQGADVNGRDGRGATPLERALENNVDMIRILAAVGADLNTRNNNGATPAYIAAYKGNELAIRTLAELGADLNTAADDNITPSYAAAHQGHELTIRALAELGADLNTPNCDGTTPAYVAAERGHELTIRALAELGADLNSHKNDGTTPAYVAAQENHVASVRTLAELGADLNTPEMHGFTPAYVAAYRGNELTIRALAELGADLTTPAHDGTTPTYVAAHQGHELTIRALVELGADLNTPKNEGTTPACIAAHDGHALTLSALAELGADLNTSNDNGFTPAYVAAHTGRLEVLKVLVNYSDVNFDLVANNGASPLMAAVKYGPRDICVLLVNIGVDVKRCLPCRGPPPVGVNHVREMMTEFCTRVSLPNAHDVDCDFKIVKCCLFSLTNLMCSARLGLCSSAEGINDDSNGDDAPLLSSFQTHVAVSMWQMLSAEVLKRMQATCYVLKRKLVLIAWRVYQSTLLKDGDRLNAVAKARRYTELVCFLFDLTMLSDVLALRLTCKSNHERRRFSVCYMWCIASSRRI